LRSFSLRSRLIVIATLVLATALGVVGVALDAANYRGAVSSLQARMESYVYLVLAAMEVAPSGSFSVDDNLADPRLMQPGSGILVEVQGREQSWRSPSSLGLQLPDVRPAEAGAVAFTEPESPDGYFLLRYGIGWQLPDDSIEPFTVSVRVAADELAQQTSAFRLGLWRALVAAGAILLLAQVVILMAVFRPLGRVARDVARVETGQAPRLEGHHPRELEPLVRNVNRLLATEKSNQERIRNALDSLAHSLKTPLAVIQAGLPLHGDPGGSMQNAVDEMRRLIATRLERAGFSARRTLTKPVPVAPQLRRIIASLQKVHSQKMIRCDENIDESLVFCGEKRDLLELTGNLLDNAFKYGRGRVRVSGGVVKDGPEAASTRPGLWLTVEDDGPGIDESQWERLLQRGVRGDERVEGHGLGLAIVSELVSAYGGTMDIGHSELGGARVSVSIPAT
jgi:two-component system sensor histidine kinase PhoQ